jgi:hypothetical protein
MAAIPCGTTFGRSKGHGLGAPHPALLRAGCLPVEDGVAHLTRVLIGAVPNVKLVLHLHEAWRVIVLLMRRNKRRG